MSTSDDSPNFELWKRVMQEQYPHSTDDSYRRMLQIGASDWGQNRDTNVAKLFEQYVMLKQLIRPKGDQDGD